MSEGTYNKLRPVGSKPGLLSVPAKVHKPLKNRLPPFRPILSATGTLNINCQNFVHILSDITQNKFTVQDSFAFVDETLKT